MFQLVCCFLAVLTQLLLPSQHARVPRTIPSRVFIFREWVGAQTKLVVYLGTRWEFAHDQLSSKTAEQTFLL